MNPPETSPTPIRDLVAHNLRKWSYDHYDPATAYLDIRRQLGKAGLDYIDVATGVVTSGGYVRDPFISYPDAQQRNLEYARRFAETLEDNGQLDLSRTFETAAVSGVRGWEPRDYQMFNYHMMARPSSRNPLKLRRQLRRIGELDKNDPAEFANAYWHSLDGLSTRPIQRLVQLHDWQQSPQVVCEAALARHIGARVMSPMIALSSNNRAYISLPRDVGQHMNDLNRLGSETLLTGRRPQLILIDTTVDQQ